MARQSSRYSPIAMLRCCIWDRRNSPTRSQHSAPSKAPMPMSKSGSTCLTQGVPLKLRTERLECMMISRSSSVMQVKLVAQFKAFVSSSRLMFG